MSENTSKDQNSQADNDEDFGLPPVSINPLEPAPAGKPPVAPVAGKKSPSGKPKVATDSRGKKNKPAEKKKSRSGNGVFVWIILLILLIGFGAYYWGNLGDFSDEKPAEPPLAMETPVEESPAAVAPSEPKEEIPVTKEADDQPGLTEIDGRGTSPRYFLVVGSFIDDDLARDYSAKLNKEGLQTFLIHPYGNIPFYRLAVGQYENVDLALEAREDSQEAYTENLWVLKY
ncbi:SPOR domain-containing protein [Cyclobacterium xiamenense]|jgi:cell division septation protein DedD|uniref:SPOR domain-containing protein n=1 Tax=Cyclobacterium xiamenense TaxID=1297121 RepID=UPI0035CF8128